MSDFTNSANRSPGDAQSYVASILRLLGEQDPIEVLLHTGPALERALQGVSPERLVQPEAEGKWSMRHVVAHLADSELVWGYRLRMVLAQPRPVLAGYDQDLWADRLRYDDVDAADALALFRALRVGNLRLLDRVPQEDLERAGFHAERGEETVRQMLRLYAGHDLAHLKQFERIRAAVGG